MGRKGALFAAALLGLGLGAAATFVTKEKPPYAPRTGKETLEEAIQRLEKELPLSTTRKPYLILDLLGSRLDYRISGITTKSIAFGIDSIRKGGVETRPEPTKMMIRRVEDRGAPPEVIVPPDPDKPVDPLKDPKLFPPDPPSDFTLILDQGTKVRFLGQKGSGWKGKMEGMGRAVKDWLPWGPGSGRKETHIQLLLPAERAQEIYRALYRDESVLVMGLGDSPRSEPSRAAR
jgi:hypothetical protein